MAATPLTGWCAGTHAAAGPIPVDSLSHPTLAVSPGPRPAKYRPAIPTRAYETGSGARHDPAPAHHPHPPRPPPAPVVPGGPASLRGRPSSLNGALRASLRDGLRPPFTPETSAAPARRQHGQARAYPTSPPAGDHLPLLPAGHGAEPREASRHAREQPGGNVHKDITRDICPASEVQKLDRPFHMRSPGAQPADIGVPGPDAPGRPGFHHRPSQGLPGGGEQPCRGRGLRGAEQHGGGLDALAISVWPLRSKVPQDAGHRTQRLRVINYEITFRRGAPGAGSTPGPLVGSSSLCCTACPRSNRRRSPGRP